MTSLAEVMLFIDNRKSLFKPNALDEVNTINENTSNGDKLYYSTVLTPGLVLIQAMFKTDIQTVTTKKLPC